MTAQCTLIADTRERHVLRHIYELSRTRMEVRQITVGDYIVQSATGTIMAVIERKSLDDFAASLKDGRALNRSKLIDLRAETGCRIIFIIEGAAGTMHGGIPYATIESSIFHLIVRDAVCILRTANSLDTAKTLARFMTSMNTLTEMIVPHPVTSIDQVLGGEPVPAERLTRPEHMDDHDTVRGMWACIPGIGTETASYFIVKWSLADIICGRVPRADLLAYKPGGRKMSKKVVSGITGIASRAIEIRMLTMVLGMSRAGATRVLTDTSLAQLLARVDIAALPMSATRSVGPRLAERILRLFNYCAAPSAAQQ